MSSITPRCHDVALRDFGLLIGAVALARLGAAYDGPAPTPRQAGCGQ
jgi:hypothetical protein